MMKQKNDCWSITAAVAQTNCHWEAQPGTIGSAHYKRSKTEPAAPLGPTNPVTQTTLDYPTIIR